MDLIDKQLRDLGPDCGWDSADQKDFLRIWTKHGGKQVIAFNNEVQRAVAGKDLDQIAEHVAKYKLMLDLTKNKKELINQYKTLKDAERLSKLSDVKSER